MPKSRGMLFGVFIALLLWGAMGGCARAQTYPVVRVEDYPEYANVRAQLQALVNAYGFHDRNQFCIITYNGPDMGDDPIPSIYWPTQNKYIAWGSGPQSSIIGASDYFDLTRDIVPDNYDNGANTSTYLMTRSEVDGIINDCRGRGEKYTITKTHGGWVSISKFSQFVLVNEQLQDLVDLDSSPKINKFCVIGQKDGSFLAAYVYWQTQEQLIMWLPDKNFPDDPYAVAYADVDIDLKHGLRDQEDGHDDRDEMQRSYAQSILKA